MISRLQSDGAREVPNAFFLNGLQRGIALWAVVLIINAGGDWAA